MELRLDLAHVLFQSGDYRRAVHAYRAAAVTLSEFYGPDDPRVLNCREQEAVSQAHLGATGTALTHLPELSTPAAVFRRKVRRAAPSAVVRQTFQ